MEIRYSSRVTDYGGDKAYAFWQEDCFCPRIYFVRGDSWEDAYENFLQVLPEEDMTYPNLDREQEEEWRKACLPENVADGQYGPGMGSLEGFTFRDGGGIVYTELVNGRRIMDYIGGEDY